MKAFVFCGRDISRFIGNRKKAIKEIYHLPLINTQSIDHPKPSVAAFNYAVVSSSNIVKYFKYKKFLQVESWIAIGPETARSMKIFWDLNDVLTPDEYNALSAAKLILSKKKVGSVLWLGAEGGVHTGIDLLREKGYSVEVITSYKNFGLTREEIKTCSPIPLEELLAKEAIWIFTSPSAARCYLKYDFHRKNHLISCLGMSTAAPFFQKGIIPYHIPKQSSLISLQKDLWFDG